MTTDHRPSNQGNNRKRAFSTPQITPALAQQMLVASSANRSVQSSAMSSSNGKNTSSDRSLYWTDQNVWPTSQKPYLINVNDNGNQPQPPPPPILQHLDSDSNIYTNLALGNERYKLPTEFTTSVSPGVSITTTSSNQREGDDDDDDDDDDGDLDDLNNENVEDLEESTDQFSPLLYTSSQPIAISAGNSPAHKPNLNLVGGLTSYPRSPNRATSPTPTGSGHQQYQHMAFSASPNSGVFPYSPFYSGSPDTATQIQMMPQQAMAAYSYDVSYGANINRLPLPQQQGQQQQQQEQHHQNQTT